MYAETKTWNPFKGCEYHCIYCIPSFQQICRVFNKCPLCKAYVSHYHPERLNPNMIPNKKMVFVCGNGDITFCKPEFVRKIINAIKLKNKTHPAIIYYFQSKNPSCLEQYLGEFSHNMVILTTLETNRDVGYDNISKAPKPSQRWAVFRDLVWDRKIATVEPVLNFDRKIFFEWIISLSPECVYIGYNSRPEQVQLPEPSYSKTQKFINDLREYGIEVRIKDGRGKLY